MKYIKIGNSNEFIVFLHGWGADKNSFLWVSSYIKNKSMIFVDFNGFGESPEPEYPYTVFDYAFNLKKILDNYKIYSLIIVGHSFGGRVAVKFSSLYQFCYENYKLCLVDAAGLIPRRGLFYYYKVYKYKLLKKIAKISKKSENLLSKYGSKDYKQLSTMMKQTFNLIVNEDLSKDAALINVSTFIVWGVLDKETKLYMAKKYNKLIVNSKLFLINDAGHFSFLDKPQEFLIILDTLIKN